MSVKLIAPFAGNLAIGDGYIVRFTALDPITGATVTGVTVSNVNVDGEQQGGSVSTQISGFKLVPGPNG